MLLSLGGLYIMFRKSRACVAFFVACVALGASPSAWSTVDVQIVGDTAIATIDLTDGEGVTYSASMTIVFDTPSNLTAEALNVSAELVTQDGIQPRLPLPPPVCHGNHCTAGAELDPDFPIMVTIEPIAGPWLFADGFDGMSGDLSFLNSYDVEIHTQDLTYYAKSPYRLMKAPVGGMFYDITNTVTRGSVRVRGRGGDFSQFLIAKVSEAGSAAWVAKIAQFRARIGSAAIDDDLRADLLARLDETEALLASDIPAAIEQLDALTAEIDADAGTDIPNVWTARRDVTNDAGIMQETSATLHFSMENPGPPAWCDGGSDFRGECGS